jgi:hypothetical protein
MILKIAEKRILIKASIATIIGVGILWALSYHSFEFKGGMGIRDSGFFSYPRYHAELGELPLWQDGENQYVIRGLPPGPLDLGFEVVDAASPDRDELTSLLTSLSISMTEQSGKEICSATGRLSDAKNNNRSSWVLASSSSRVSFWQSQCQQLPISRFKAYTVKVIITGADSHSPHKMLRTVLSGGGTELP